MTEFYDVNAEEAANVLREMADMIERGEARGFAMSMLAPPLPSHTVPDHIRGALFPQTLTWRHPEATLDEVAGLLGTVELTRNTVIQSMLTDPHKFRRRDS